MKTHLKIIFFVLVILCFVSIIACSGESVENDNKVDIPSVDDSIDSDSIVNKCQISYVLDEGVNSENNLSEYNCGENIEFKSAEKYGYTFLGWIYNENLIDEKFCIPNVDEIELTAKWELDCVYVLGNGCYEVSKATNLFSRKVEVLSEYLGGPVRVIREQAFENMSNLEKMVLPDSIRYIYDYAFNNCTNLSVINFGESLREIGCFAFKNCLKLSSVKFGENLQEIDCSAFENCSNLQEVAIPSKILSVGEKAFKDCVALRSIDLGETISVIEQSLFENCLSLQEIVLPNSILNIEKSAFKNNKNLLFINFGNRLEFVGDEAFYGCEKISEIALPSTVYSLGSKSFYNCIALKSISLSDNIGLIGEETFYNCKTLKEITIPKSCRQIKTHAFEKCENLTNINMYENLYRIDYGAFFDCDSLKRLDYNGDIKSWCNIAFSRDLNGEESIFSNPFSVCNAMYIDNEQIKNLDLSECENIPYLAFANCSSIESINFGETITNIEDKAFMGCSGLKEIVLPNSISTIGKSAFANCTELEIINFRYNANSIQREILSDAFLNCKNLKKVIYKNNASYWAKFIFENETANPTYYAKHLFMGNTELTSITVFSDVGDYCFINCESITFVGLRGSVGKSSFYGCSILSEIEMGSDVETLGEKSFMYCTSLSKINFSGSRGQWSALMYRSSPYWNKYSGNYTIYCKDATFGK